MRKPLAVIWSFPSRGSFVTNIPEHEPPEDNPPPLKVGTAVRCADMLGEVLPDRVVNGVPVHVRSVAVKCTFSLSRFPRLDVENTNVWSLGLTQVLEGELLEVARNDPESFVRKFMELEEKVRIEAAKQNAARKKKKLPGKGKSK